VKGVREVGTQIFRMGWGSPDAVFPMGRQSIRVDNARKSLVGGSELQGLMIVRHMSATGALS
jgi:hypothetical protein